MFYISRAAPFRVHTKAEHLVAQVLLCSALSTLMLCMTQIVPKFLKMVLYLMEIHILLNQTVQNLYLELRSFTQLSLIR